MWWSAIDRVLNEYLPSIGRLLQRIEIECYEVVEEIAFHLAAEDVDLAAEYVQCVAISSGRPWTSW